MAYRIQKPVPELTVTQVLTYLAQLHDAPDRPDTIGGVLDRVRGKFGNEPVNDLLRKSVVQRVCEVKLGDLVLLASTVEHSKEK